MNKYKVKLYVNKYIIESIIDGSDQESALNGFYLLTKIDRSDCKLISCESFDSNAFEMAFKNLENFLKDPYIPKTYLVRQGPRTYSVQEGSDEWDALAKKGIVQPARRII